MNKRFSDDIHYGLASPRVDAQTLDSLFFDDPAPGGSAKRNTKSVTFGMSSEMYEAAQNLIHSDSLAFQASLSALLRHALAMTIEGLEAFLDEDVRTLFRAFMRQQRRLARERIILTVEELIEQHVEALQFWTAKEKWGVVVKDVAAFVGDVESYPEPEWREHAAKMWMQHPGIRAQLKAWANTMREDSEVNWKMLQEAVGKMEAMAGG